MPGFVAPSATPKARTGKPNRPKKTGETQHPFKEKPVDPLQHAEKSIPGFASRHRNTNNKSGFNTIPGRPFTGRHCVSPTTVHRGAGKEVGSNEKQDSATTGHRRGNPY